MACCKFGRYTAPGSVDKRVGWWADNNGDAAMLAPSVDLSAADLVKGLAVGNCQAEGVGEQDHGAVRSRLVA